jgi:type III secretion system needle length determinant
MREGEDGKSAGDERPVPEKQEDYRTGMENARQDFAAKSAAPGETEKFRMGTEDTRQGFDAKSTAPGETEKFRTGTEDARQGFDANSAVREKAEKFRMGTEDARQGFDAKSAAPGETEKSRIGADLPDAPQDIPPPVFSGDALLRGLGENYVRPATDAAAAAPHDESAAAELFDRILVARADQSGGSGEVRITLRKSILPDTEIILRREGERLIVSLLTDNAASHRALVQARQDLHDKLLTLEKDVSVEIAGHDAGGREDGNASSGRSRGYDYYRNDEASA